MTMTGLELPPMVPNPLPLLATAVLVASIHLQVRAVEEPYLARTHGPAYAAGLAGIGDTGIVCIGGYSDRIWTSKYLGDALTGQQKACQSESGRRPSVVCGEVPVGAVERG
jgi:hypothetical protein